LNKKIENIKINHEIIDYLAGEASEEEKVRILEWIDSSDENKIYFHKVKELWNNKLSAEDLLAFQTDKGWKRFSEKYQITAKRTERSIEGSGTRKIVFNVLRVAAVLVIGLVLWQSGWFDSREITHSTDLVKEEITLPDKSLIYLNNNSQLSYYSNLNRKKTREIHFSGEAFFDISPDPNKPFIIYTNNVKVEVKGTSFNIRSYPGEPVEVTVKTGIVEVIELSENKLAEPVTLREEEKIKLDTISNLLQAEENDNPNYLAWKTESYVFDSVNIARVMESLEKGYDTTIVINNPDFNNCMLVAKFDTLSLAQIFWILQRTYDIRVSISNDTIFVDGKGCN
jgi:ferric-dicitrate binding protein FerR (iron transport regulator)